MKRAPLLVWYLLLPLAALFAGAGAAGARQDVPKEEPPAVAVPVRQLRMALFRRVKAPEFALKDLSDKEVRLSHFRGKVVLINFWTTW